MNVFYIICNKKRNIEEEKYGLKVRPTAQHMFGFLTFIKPQLLSLNRSTHKIYIIIILNI